MSWAFVLALAAGCYLTKLLGYAVPARVLESPYVARVAVSPCRAADGARS
jgi:hypothetical protein